MSAQTSDRIGLQAHDFFAGSGLVTLGLKKHFNVSYAIDNSRKKSDVYLANHGEAHFHLDDIKNVVGSELPFADLSWASFPCQDLSMAGKVSGINAERSGLVWEWLRLIDEMSNKPSILVAENVVGLINLENGKHYLELHSQIVQRGYRVGAIVLDAKYWIPQSRPRVFIIAVRSDIVIPNDLLSEGPNWMHTSKLSQIANRGLENWIWWSAKQLGERKKNLSDIVDAKTEFFDLRTLKRESTQFNSKHFDKISSNVLPEGFVATAYKRTRKGIPSIETRFDGIGGCLRTPGGGSSRQYILKKYEDHIGIRLLSPIELKRLMGAPDNFWLPNNYNDAYRAMGDAVAVPVVEWLSETILVKIANESRAKRKTG